MKQNVKFFTIVIALILLSSAILTGCMYAIAADNGEMKSYDLNGQKTDLGDSNTEGENAPAEREPENNIIEDGPTSRLPLQSKFGEYLHQEGDTVIIFSAEQYAQLKAVRESGERIPLSYEEILYLVDDSIGMYFKYDTISLYNANVDGILPFTLTFSTIQGSSSCIINPYRGDFSEFESYADALRQYEQMLQEIYAIIYYRIYMHDAGFTDITRSFDEVIAPSERGDFYEENKHVSSILLTNIYQMLAIDGSAVGGIENGDKLAGEFQKVVEWEKEFRANGVDPDKKFQSLDAPILCTEIWHNVRTPLEHRFYIYESSEALQIVFPTKELTAMKPQQTVTYQAGKEGELQPIVHLNYLTGGARISAGVEFSFAMTGSFRLEDGVLKVYFGKSESNPDYWYVFYETDEGFVYSAENSKTGSSIGRDWADGLVFKKYRESTVVQPEIDPPVNNEKDPEPVFEGWAYLKYASGSDYATLMYPDGGQHIAEGSYAKEADKLVFVFKTANGVYTYYFHYRKDRVYVFDKELSKAVPGYGFEDEMEFALTEYDGGSCFLELLEKGSTENPQKFKLQIQGDYADNIVNELEDSYLAGEKITIQLETITEHYYVVTMNGITLPQAESSLEYTYFVFQMPEEDAVLSIAQVGVEIPPPPVDSDDITIHGGDSLAQIALDDAQKETVQELLADKHDWIDQLPESVVNCYFTGFFVKAGYCSNSGTLIDYISDRSRKLTAEEKAFVESLISMLNEEPTHSGYEVEIKLLQYTWDGWGISTKEVGACDVAYNIIDALKAMKETGETVPKISDDVLEIGGGQYPVERGTMWIESSGKIYRLTPDLSQICRVETHFGEGKVLEITDEFKTDVNNAWHYAPYDYYKGTYNKGDSTVELNHVFESGSSIDISIKEIKVDGSSYDPFNTILIELISSVDQEVAVKLHCQQSDDNLARGDAKTVELKKGVPMTVELGFGGWPDFTYWVYIEADFTRTEITINP